MKKYLLTFLVLLLVSCSSAEPVANDIVEESPLEVQTDDTTTTCLLYTSDAADE